ncbi:MAG: Mth938-like domain-containing protein [Rhodocyclaceae bacterium]|nr:Mth938-like domain-containing protein [Rhodocyclaceae bacterium]
MSGTLWVTAHGPGYVVINGQPYRQSLILLPTRIELGWRVASFADLTVEHFVRLSSLDCDVLLFGTGDRQRFPSPALLRPLLEVGRPLEIMDTPAACRTYNILLDEGRFVAAALLIEPADQTEIAP